MSLPLAHVLGAESALAALRDDLVAVGVRLTDSLAEADVVVAGPTATATDLDALRPDAGVIALGAAAATLGPDGLHAAADVSDAGSLGAVEPAEPHGPRPDQLDLLARVEPTGLRATTALPQHHDARPLLRAASFVVAAAVTPAAEGEQAGRRWMLLGVEPASADERRSYRELLRNAVAWVAPVAATATEAVPATGDAAVHPLVSDPAWLRLKAAVSELRLLQQKDGSLRDDVDEAGHERARTLVAEVVAGIRGLAPSLPHDAAYLEALVLDFGRWVDGGFGVPDFLDSLNAFAPAQHRVDGLTHLVVFPMYTQNGNPDRMVEAVLLEVIWPDFVAELEAGDYSNRLFLPIRFLDFTAGYDTNSAVLFPETVAMREVPAFTWGGIFADREAARFRRVVAEAADVTRLSLPADAARLVADQQLAERTFVMWDLIHDRTHMHGDLPFDPFMVKQRMPFFLYALEELRCDLTAFRESVKLEAEGHPYARMVQYAVLFDRIFRFSITGSRVRNYDGLGGQLLFAWLHQRGVLHWTDNRLSVDWEAVTEPVLELGRAIEDLYWRSIDRPKASHWLAAYALVSSVVTPHPSSAWARHAAGDLTALPLDGPPKGLTDAVLPDEFPLSMFFEALAKKMKPVIESTAGITGRSDLVAREEGAAA
ncbi:hypothetical protein DFJ68_3047 [Terracoccus luteus]|uniref:Uncharacterized protein n=1 Tax=Terracoccus luteus TaxID=53356 RepID=A0A495Y2P3_9MICO|nr:hypothetical protein DFJ68_3047 [Terracoccus luteus]